MRRRLSLTAALVLLLSLLCACAAQHAQEMDENGWEYGEDDEELFELAMHDKSDRSHVVP
mgnify:CR=1 FL=1